MKKKQRKITSRGKNRNTKKYSLIKKNKKNI